MKNIVFMPAIRDKNRITQQDGKGVGYYIIGESNKIK